MMSQENDAEGEVGLCLPGQGIEKIELLSLVLQAVGVQHKVRMVGNHWDIFLQSDDLDFAVSELAAFEAENLAWPPTKPISHSLAEDDSLPFLLMVALVIFYSVTGPWQGDVNWFNAGAVSSVKILEEGEWWRLITALTLHVDASHLLGNVFLGGTFLYFLAREFGSGTASMIALLSGSIGNGLNLVFRQGNHVSVGFSTSVFGMVGAFCISRWLRTGLIGRQLLLSLGAAFGFLALLGSGGERTDLGAHLWGMAVGLIVGGGCCLPMVVKYAGSKLVQSIELLIFVVMIVISWYLTKSL